MHQLSRSNFSDCMDQYNVCLTQARLASGELQRARDEQAEMQRLYGAVDWRYKPCLSDWFKALLACIWSQCMILAYSANYLSTLMEAVFLVRQGKEETPSWKKGTTFLFWKQIVNDLRKVLAWVEVPRASPKNFPSCHLGWCLIQLLWLVNAFNLVYLASSSSPKHCFALVY